MIRNYLDYVTQRWQELNVPERSASLPPESEALKAVQVGALVTIASELRHTTRHEGRTHEDVGLLFKNWGNFYDAGNGLTIATDILCVRDVDDAGRVTDPNSFTLIDCVVAVNSPGARPAWTDAGHATGADIGRFREPPPPAAGVEPPNSAVAPAAPEVAPPPATAEIMALIRDLAERQLEAKNVIDQIFAEVREQRRDVDNAIKLLQATGGLGTLFSGRKDAPVR